MDAVIHTELATKRRRTARRLLWLGFGILLVGLFIGGRDPRTLMLSYGALIVGTILSWTGVAMLDRWVVPPRAEDALGQALEGLHGGWKRYHWSLPGAGHILQAPWGLVVVDPFNVDGPVEVRGKRYRDRRPLWRRALTIGRRPVRNPRRLLEVEADALRDAIAKQDPELADELTIEQVQVLTHPKASLDAEDPSPSVVLGDDLRRWLSRELRHKALSPAEQRRLRELLDALAAERMGVAGDHVAGDEVADDEVAEAEDDEAQDDAT